MAENEITQESSNEELDLLADSTDKARNSERPMSDKDVQTPEPKASKEEYEFTHNGKQVKGTRDQIIKWAQMGYDRPQVAQKWNQEKQQWEQEKSKYKVYQDIDAYASQNKEWWDHVSKSWQNRNQPTQPQATQPTGEQTGQPAYDPRYQTLEQKLSQLEPLVQELTQFKQTQAIQEEDTKLDKEVQSIRESHQDLDWESLDANGKSLETRVLEHARDTGIRSFRAAFRDLLHEELVGKAESLGKLAVSKGIQNQTKLGVLGQSPTSRMSRPEPKRNMRQTSYEELEREIRDELRTSKS